MSKAVHGRLDDHERRFVSLARENAYKHRLHEVFRDFCELSALALSNAADRSQLDPREARYLQIAAGYERAEMSRFAEMLSCVVESLTASMHDCLGRLFMGLELGDHWKGQFFTPYEVAVLMARLTFVDAPALVAERGFVTIQEPAAGAGGMVIAAAEALGEAGLNYQQCMHVHACDIDATAVHMCYVQCSLLNIPAVIVHGNSLSLEHWSAWQTLAHVRGGWDWRLRACARSAAGWEPAARPQPPAEVVPAPLAQPEPSEMPVRRPAQDDEQLDLFA